VAAYCGRVLETYVDRACGFVSGFEGGDCWISDVSYPAYYCNSRTAAPQVTYDHDLHHICTLLASDFKGLS